MRHWKSALCASSALLGATFATAGVASADTAGPPPPPAPSYAIAFNAGITTDYMFRGLDQSRGNPAGFGGADLTFLGKVYLGTWVSSVDFDPRPVIVDDGEGGLVDIASHNHTLAEVDIYGGVRPTFGPVNMDFGVIGYIYPKQPSGSHENYVELKALGSVAVGSFTPGIAVYYSPDNSFATGHETYLEGNLAYTFTNKASVSGAIGHEYLESSKAGLDGYTLWNVGVTYPINEHLSADIRYYGTDNSAKDFFSEDKGQPFNAADRIVGTMKVTW